LETVASSTDDDVALVVAIGTASEYPGTNPTTAPHSTNTTKAANDHLELCFNLPIFKTSYNKNLFCSPVKTEIVQLPANAIIIIKGIWV